MSLTAKQVLQQYWGHTDFRPLQKEIIDSVMSSQNTLALLPTGGGKSICYQIPALLSPGLAIVVSPLISLIRDQWSNLRSKGINAEALYSGMHKKDIERVLENCLSSRTKLLYVSPERLKSSLFIDYFKSMNISFIAVDEAHCISQWGYDFRPAYLDINKLKEHQADLHILALTATATQKVVEDIIFQLDMSDVKILRNSFLRNNISFSVHDEANKRFRLLSTLDTYKGSSIIYMRSRVKTIEIAYFLRDNGIQADYYHAGMPINERESVQNNWMRDKSRVIVATTAFGMGIDKSNVRTVIHLDLPMSPEEFYQEAGRAGRDGIESHSIVIYNEKDFNKMYSFIADSFPLKEEIIETYQGLAEYYKQGSGYQEVVFLDFDIIDVSRKLHKSPKRLLSAMKVLEWNGYLTLTDAIEQPDRILILYSKDELFDFLTYNPDFDLIMDSILRMYGGVLNLHVKINIHQIGLRCGIADETVMEKLSQLDKQGVISYLKASDKPKLSFGEFRYPQEHLLIDMSRSEFLQTRAIERAKAMELFILSPICRNITLLNYFGEVIERTCGNCDICINNKVEGKSEIIEQIVYNITDLLSQKPITINEFKNTVWYKKHEEQTVKALHFLLEEQIIYIKDLTITLHEK